jgi:hypothetical protein
LYILFLRFRAADANISRYPENIFEIQRHWVIGEKSGWMLWMGRYRLFSSRQLLEAIAISKPIANGSVIMPFWEKDTTAFVIGQLSIVIF